jgi:hypothetical protein
VFAGGVIRLFEFDVRYQQPALSCLFPVYLQERSATLDTEGKKIVALVSQHAREQPAAPVSVVGYADSAGSAPADLLLSQQRAQTVADALVANGVAADRGGAQRARTDRREFRSRQPPRRNRPRPRVGNRGIATRERRGNRCRRADRLARRRGRSAQIGARHAGAIGAVRHRQHRDIQSVAGV